MKSNKKGKEKNKSTKPVLAAAGVDTRDTEKLSENDSKTQKSRKKKTGHSGPIAIEAMQCTDENESKSHMSGVVSSGKRKTDQLSEKKQKKTRKDEPKSETKEIVESMSSDIAKEDTKGQAAKVEKKKSKNTKKGTSLECTIEMKENMGSEEDGSCTEMKQKKNNSIKSKRGSEIISGEKMEGDESEKNLTRTKSKMERKRKSVNEVENELVVENDSGGNIEPNQSEESSSKKKKKRKLQNMEEEAVDEENKTVSSEGGERSEKEKKQTTESKKSKKKKKKEKNKETGQTEEATSDPEQKADKLASEYLNQWANNRESWKFQKVRQVWLLKHMYSENKVTNEDFTVLLSYLDGMKGRSREVTVEQAEKIIEEDGEKDEVDQVKNERARQIVQLLT